MQLDQIESRLKVIEDRLLRIEDNLQISAPVYAAKEINQSTPFYDYEAAAINKPTLNEDDQSSLSINWLGIIATICFVLAAGFIIKLSIESGWLTPARQIALAGLFGFSLIGSGLILLPRDRAYLSLLPATGIIVLFITAFAAHRLYFLISFNFALALIACISGLCIWLHLKIKQDIYAILASVGAYVAPIVFFNTMPSPLFTLYYFILCSLAFAFISILVTSRILCVISAYLAIFVSALIGFEANNIDKLMTIVLPIHFLIFSLSTVIHTRIFKQPLTKDEAWGFFPILLLFYGVEYYFFDKFNHQLAPWISLGFAGLTMALYLYAKTNSVKQELNSKPVVFAFISIVCFHSIYLELLPADFRPWLFVFAMIGISFISLNKIKEANNAWFFPIAAIALILILEYFYMMSYLLTGFDPAWVAVSLAAVASIWLARINNKSYLTNYLEFDYFVLGTTHLLAITSLYRLTTDHGSLAVSASWLFYAICVMSFAFIRKDKIMASSALLVLALAAGKALLYDAASAPTVVRILCLLLTGVVLYAAGFFVKKITQWDSVKK